MFAWMAATVFCLVGLLTAYHLGYRAALRRHHSQLCDGTRYRQALDEALDGCRGQSKVEVFIETRRAARPELSGTGSLGLHVVPRPEDRGDT